MMFLIKVLTFLCETSFNAWNIKNNKFNLMTACMSKSMTSSVNVASPLRCRGSPKVFAIALNDQTHPIILAVLA